MSILVFDNKNKNLFFSDFKLDFSTNVLEIFNQYNSNEILINIISNTKKISEEIDLIINDIKKNYKETVKSIHFSTSNLTNISFIFEKFNFMAADYSTERLQLLQNIINQEETLIERYTNELVEYEEALNTSALTEEDNYSFIFYIENNFINDFPKRMISKYNKLKNYKYKNVLDVKKDNEEYNKYIFNTYCEEYKKYISETIKNYPKTIKNIKNNIKEISKKYETNKLKISTYYFDTFINFLENTRNAISYLEYQVKALNCIGYDDDDVFDWNSITKEERLFLANIYANPFKLSFNLPKSQIIYAIEENNKITTLTDYAYTSIISNKGKPYINIIQDFLQKKLIELHQYECKDIIEIINVLFYQYKISNIQINKCLNCGKYFIPKKKSNEKYCDNISPQNKTKTCKEFGVNKIYREGIKSLPIKNEHNKLSQAFRMRIIRAKNEDIKIQEEKNFKKYKEAYQRKKQQYMKNKISESEFVNWIIQQKKLYKQT